MGNTVAGPGTATGIQGSVVTVIGEGQEKLEREPAKALAPVANRMVLKRDQVRVLRAPCPFDRSDLRLVMGFAGGRSATVRWSNWPPLEYELSKREPRLESGWALKRG